MTFTIHYLKTPTGTVAELRTGSRRIDSYPGARRSAEGGRYIPCEPRRVEQEKQAVKSFVWQTLREETIFTEGRHAE